MSEQMTIQQWFCLAVSARLIPVSAKNIFAISDIGYSKGFYLSIDGEDFEAIGDIQKFSEDGEIQLRQDGKDLFELEWRKPTEQDIGKMCWFADRNFDQFVFGKLSTNPEHGYQCARSYYDYCLLADHGQIAPNIQDFERVYHDHST